MDKRLLWNFELQNIDQSLALLADTPREDIRWEARFFWPEKDVIGLFNLSESFLDFANCTIKNRQDNYFILPDYPFNLKIRRQELLYKPLLQKSNGIDGFGQKIDIFNLTDEILLPTDPALTKKQLEQLITKSGKKITIKKTAFIYKFPYKPTIKLELARLRFENKVFFSACLEGRSHALVLKLSQNIFPSMPTLNYVDFLKKELDI